MNSKSPKVPIVMFSREQMSQYLVIGGATKSGSTSLYRYLSKHPECIGSCVKELEFFGSKYSEARSTVNDYERYFGNAPRSLLRVEGTPHYLYHPDQVVPRLIQILPRAKLLFILRNPTDRLISYYRSSVGHWERPVGKVSSQNICDYLRILVNGGNDRVDRPMEELRRELTRGQYADNLEKYLDCLPPGQVKVVFFDDLEKNTEQLLKDIASWAGINSEPFEHLSYNIENKSRAHRSVLLRKGAGIINRRFERYLNRLPNLRIATRKLYDLLNTRGFESDSNIDYARNLLADYYIPYNVRLAEVLEHYCPEVVIPVWVRTKNSHGQKELQNPLKEFQRH